MTTIQTFDDGSVITFENGSFDSWCVLLKRPGQTKYAPTDRQYFTKLQQLGEIHGHQRLYGDFLKFYALTSVNIDPYVLNLIRQLSSAYITDSLEIEILFTILYAGMIAEENKQFAILKKRIKRLGMHQTLIELKPPEFAASFSKGRKWQELDQICKTKGF
ncbi:DUF7004 family protein [Alkaliflexus imshenetskii]|uniref:DUF7004 family protein n=1 Tax=Alkaliflexus imshenetskii TaxID=286730 RepID=UPI00047D58FD|nr:hypothetical protein [Alkaliflexus imshenetskii]